MAPRIKCSNGSGGTASTTVGLLRSALPPDHHPMEAPLLMAPRLIESCFQTAGLLELGTSGRMALPQRIARLRVLCGAPAVTPVYAVVTPRARRRVRCAGRRRKRIGAARDGGLPDGRASRRGNRRAGAPNGGAPSVGRRHGRAPRSSGLAPRLSARGHRQPRRTGDAADPRRARAERRAAGGDVLHTIALFTEPERRALFVRQADEAVCLGPAAGHTRRAARPRTPTSTTTA